MRDALSIQDLIKEFTGFTTCEACLFCRMRRELESAQKTESPTAAMLLQNTGELALPVIRKMDEALEAATEINEDFLQSVMAAKQMAQRINSPAMSEALNEIERYLNNMKRIAKQMDAERDAIIKDLEYKKSEREAAQHNN